MKYVTRGDLRRRRNEALRNPLRVVEAESVHASEAVGRIQAEVIRGGQQARDDDHCVEQDAEEQELHDARQALAKEWC